MTQKQLLASSREFIERTYSEVDARMPSKKAVEMAAKEVASAIASVRPDIDTKPTKRRA